MSNRRRSKGSPGSHDCPICRALGQDADTTPDHDAAPTEPFVTVLALDYDEGVAAFLASLRDNPPP